MISKKSKQIMELFIKDIRLEANVRTISKMLGTAYPKVYNTIKQLVKEKYLKIRDSGAENICSIDLNEKTIALISYLEYDKAYSSNIPNMEKILKYFEDDIILVTGSYATGNQTARSDMDVVIITSGDAHKKLTLLEGVTSLLDPEVHSLSFTGKDYEEMLLSDSENLGKEVFRKHLIFLNADKYYRILKKVMNRGKNI
jgi:predicted nucleotidyltransferase